jgi:hypothetical protein
LAYTCVELGEQLSGRGLRGIPTDLSAYCDESSRTAHNVAACPYDLCTVGVVGQWDKWYRAAIPRAEQLYDDYLAERGKETGR